MMAARCSSDVSFSRLAFEVRFFIAGVSRMPSTALILAKPAKPITKPFLALLRLDFFRCCIDAVYHN
jgi:hypothetical protein